MTTDQKSPKQFARMIRDYLKNLPEQYADDPKSVQDALGLSDADFKLGLDLLLERKIIVLDKAGEAAKESVSDASAAKAEDAPGKRASTSTMEVAAVGSAW
jgi:hypothetical protein